MSKQTGARDICLINPELGRSRGGNRVTALRWAKILRGLGWRPRVMKEWRGESCLLAVCLHGRKSLPSLRRLLIASPRPRIVVAMTGTDIYGEGKPTGGSTNLPEELDQVDHFVVLQDQALLSLPANLRQRSCVIRQSMPKAACSGARPQDRFDVALLAGVREAKDPMLAARVVR